MSSIGDRIHRAFNRSIRVAPRPLVISGIVCILLFTAGVNAATSSGAWIVLGAIVIVLGFGFVTRGKKSDVSGQIDDQSADSQSPGEKTISKVLSMISFLCVCAGLVALFLITFFLLLFAPCVFQMSPETRLFFNRLPQPVWAALVFGIPCLVTAAVGWAIPRRKPRIPSNPEPPENSPPD